MSMINVISVNRQNLTDLNVLQCGSEMCSPGHFFGPAVRDYYLIHYIKSGCGVFQVHDKTYNLSKGQGFLIKPGILSYYRACVNDPWYYSWIGFNGLRAEEYLLRSGFTKTNPVFEYKKDEFIQNCFDEIMNSDKKSFSKELRITGYLYLFFSALIEENITVYGYREKSSGKEDYVKKVIEFIELNYSRKITIGNIAKIVGLNRSYMGALFKSCFKVSPQEFLINYRIDKACELLKKGELSVSETSRSVGYEDPLLFSKTFKKLKGVSPREYMENPY